MADRYMHTVLTPAVLEAERHYYGRTYPDFEGAPKVDALTASEVAFIEDRDSFYMATITENGWPYLQHRGGRKGFLKVTGENELMFADHGGNRQMISVGSLAVNDRVSLFLMDYPARERLKILGHAKVLDAREHPDLVERIAPPGGHAAKVERIMVIDVLSYDWNCPKFITPRFTPAEIETAIVPLKNRIAELEAQLKTYQSES
ncbi:pyridoxamine 5'-phosphate oxidase family protein [Phragmitibacter flavus]|uniref:Pyridoxamine 5'-phosphate oxidase family protein n=1 Tax=Phragmitibacter flavus TaxID=2576071 RepID=A0A5R8KAZ1_9BACT|nr:pyridoxamine 5'-phosphate oxidase family protein [Phragmitibacter flavus]TLD69482.1 pyridoxamine 5'-phosphate oxidase family protein [Phragmitibacter flavus]